MSDYMVVERTNLSEFEARVTQLINAGYEPVGQLIAETEADGFCSPLPVTTYRQALIKMTKAKP